MALDRSGNSFRPRRGYTKITFLEEIKYTHSLEVLKAWIDPVKEGPQDDQYRCKGMFMIDGKSIRLASRMK
jgi:hypothetical protein